MAHDAAATASHCIKWVPFSVFSSLSLYFYLSHHIGRQNACSTVLHEIWSIIYFSFEKCSVSCWKFSLINIVCFVKLVRTDLELPRACSIYTLLTSATLLLASPNCHRLGIVLRAQHDTHLTNQCVAVMATAPNKQLSKASKIHSSFLSMLFIMSSVSLTPLSDVGTEHRCYM